MGIIAHIVANALNFPAAGRAALCVVLLDGSGNQITSIGGTGGTSSNDRTAFTAGTTPGTPAMGVFESAPTTLADGQIGLIGLTNDRKVKVSGTFSSTPITAGTSATTSVAASGASQTMLAANANRLAFTMYNDSDKPCYVKLGATASATSLYRKVLPGGNFSTTDVGVNYTGVIDAIWDAGVAGSMRITELSA